MRRDLLNAMDPVGWARRTLGFEPDQQQQLVLASASKRILLNCSRQWGKSTVTAAKAVHRALEFPGQLIIAMSPTARQTGELIRKMEGFLRQCGLRAKGDGSNEQSILLPNGSRIVGLPGGEGTIRGFSSVNLLIVDEAARVGDESYRAARPMLAVANGDLLLLSTPYGKRGFFYEEWAGPGEWLRLSVRGQDCPRIRADFLADERRSLGDLWFRQEYCCEFIDNETQLFGTETIRRALDKDIEPLF